MYLTQLRTFLEAYRTNSITRAAERLAITQPAASQHIKVLETAIGKPLFIRDKKGISSTIAGHELAKSIGHSIDSLEEAFASFKSQSLNISGTVHVASPGEFLQIKAASALSNLVDYGINLRIQTGNRDFLYNLLNSNAVDLAIVASKPTHTGLGFEKIMDEKFQLVASSDWCLKHNAQQLSIHDFLDKKLIAYDEDLPLIRQFFNNALGQDINTKATITVPDLRSVLSFVLTGAGYSVLPDYLCAQLVSEGKLKILLNQVNPPINSIYLAWPKIALRDPKISFTKDRLLEIFSRQF